MAERTRQDDFVKICERCRSKCCYQARPPLTRARVELISRYLTQKGEGCLLRREGRYSHPEELADGYCILFNRTNGLCRVHPVKPETCVAGPITFDINPKEGKIEWYLKTEKICPLAGEMARHGTSLSRHLESAKREILRLLEGLDGEELKAILEIEEEDTLKIGEDYIGASVLEKVDAPSSSR